MSNLPEGMLQSGRPSVPRFDPEEYLYRRIPPELWDESSPGLPIDLHAIALPDMSVGRSQFAHPEWLRLASGCSDWGVVGFRVRSVPPERWIDGIAYEFSPEHAPERRNYPHSEVRAYERSSGNHVDGKSLMLPPRVHLEWRERLLRAVQVFLKNREPAAIRQYAPKSHKPETDPS